MATGVKSESPDPIDSSHNNDVQEVLGAARRGNGSKLHALFEKGVSPNIADERGVTPLLAHPNAINKSGQSSLHLLIQSFSPFKAPSFEAMMNALLAHSDTDPNIVNKDDRTLIHWAAANDLKNVVNSLLVHPRVNLTTIKQSRYTPLHSAASRGHKDMVELLTPHFNPGAVSPFGTTPLHSAASNGHKDVVEALIALPDVNPHAVNQFGITPLHKAAANGHKDVAEILVAIPGANLDAADEFGMTPLMSAASRGHTEVVKLLLARGADPNIRSSKEKKTALHHAIIGGRYLSATVLYQRVSEETLSSMKKLQYFVEFEKWCNTKIELDQKV